MSLKINYEVNKIVFFPVSFDMCVDYMHVDVNMCMSGVCIKDAQVAGTFNANTVETWERRLFL